MSAVEAAVAVAAAHGLRCDEPVVLSEAWHVLVHLRPFPVVARVTSGAAGVDPGDVERELAVAGHAASRGRAGCPAESTSFRLARIGGTGTRSSSGATSSGRASSTRPPPAGASQDPRLAWDYDGELPRGGRAAEVRAMLAPFAPSDDVELLCELASRELPEGQALHGDAHLFNCIQTLRSCLARPGDRVPRPARVRPCRARPGRPLARSGPGGSGGARRVRPLDEDVLEQALPVYASWVAASFMVAVARRPDAAPALERQLRFLRRFRS